ncbi:protein of unknown function DUF1963, partial [Kipferlia bialata]
AGGIGFLSEDEELPQCGECGEQMALVVQLNLSQLPEDVQESLRLGDEGLIQLYMCKIEDTDCETWEAFSTAELVRFVPPEDMENARTREDILSLYESEDKVYREAPIVGVVKRAQDFPKGDEMSFGVDHNDDMYNALHEFVWENGATSGIHVGGWFNWCQGVEYPDCPECGETMTGTVLNIESIEDQIGLMWGDCGTAQICQCPNHEK